MPETECRWLCSPAGDTILRVPTALSRTLLNAVSGLGAPAKLRAKWLQPGARSWLFGGRR